MKTYESHITEFGTEIADEIVRREKDPSWVNCLDRSKIAKSISIIYEVELRKATEDLEDAIKKALKKTNDKSNYR